MTNQYKWLVITELLDKADLTRLAICSKFQAKL